ncbi:MAG: L,D-transpeptidase family protein, partial [Rhizobiaceae bacterium]
PKSSYHLSFNMGFPNRYDRAHGRTGAHLMVHGACSSAGCYSMTDEYVEEIYALAREAFSGGQKAFQIQAYPFRMTPINMVRHRGNKHFEFWKMIKQGYDHFEITKVPPKVDVCDRRYVFNTQGKGSYNATAACPVMEMPQRLATSFLKRQQSYALSFEKLLPSAERQNIAALAPVSVESVLPGVTVAGPKPIEKPGEAGDKATPKPETATPSTEANEPATKSARPNPLTTGSVKKSLSGDG